MILRLIVPRVASRPVRQLTAPSGRGFRAIIASILLLSTLAVAPTYAEAPIDARDISVCMNFQGPRGFATDFLMGRMLLAGYLDDDDLLDFVFGNPGDPSFVGRTIPSDSPDCSVEIEVVQILSEDEVYWTGGLADLDNDGDLDLFIGGGGNENAEHNVYWKNLWQETGSLVFEDVTSISATVFDELGNPTVVSIARHSWDKDFDGNGTPGDEILATSGVDFADVNNDGWIDIFLSGNLSTPGPQGCSQKACGRNTLWLNNGDGVFTDVTEEIGLAGNGNRTRHAAFFDYDNDHYQDVLVSNYLGSNYVFRNELGTSGVLSFVDVTDEIVAPRENAAYPWDAFGSRTFDVNNDGLEDFMLATHAPRQTFELPGGQIASRWVDCGGETVLAVAGVHGAEELSGRTAPPGELDHEVIYDPAGFYASEASPYPEANHALFVGGPEGFENRATEYGLNQRLLPFGGVMGWQVGDLNADGIPDIGMGNGGPRSGQGTYLLLSDGTRPWGEISYDDHSDLLNRLNVAHDPLIPEELYDRWPVGVPPSFRGHGMLFVDVDNDGELEFLSTNGGTKFIGDFGDVREPNRGGQVQMEFTAAILEDPTPRRRHHREPLRRSERESRSRSRTALDRESSTSG